MAPAFLNSSLSRERERGRGRGRGRDRETDRETDRERISVLQVKQPSSFQLFEGNQYGCKETGFTPKGLYFISFNSDHVQVSQVH